jgi:hypothetical protein
VVFISPPRAAKKTLRTATGRGDRWLVAERTVRPLCLIFHAPFLDHDLRLLQRIKNLSIQALIAQLPVEVRTIPVRPRAPRLDVQHPRAHLGQAIPQFFRHELDSRHLDIRGEAVDSREAEENASLLLSDLIPIDVIMVNLNGLVPPGKSAAFFRKPK